MLRAEPFDLSALPSIHVDAVDGVPVLWVDAPPPFTMVLMFRVGQGDESMSNSGITHLVEHLAFPHDHAQGVSNNGETHVTKTLFYAWGDPGDATQFVNGICRALSRLPVHRLPEQRAIILTEEQSAGGSALGDLLLERYGPVGPGLAGYKQLGLHAMTPERLRGWTERFFTSGNAIVYMTGPPPGRLELELPAGQRHALPDARPADGPLPKWTAHFRQMISLSMVTGHDTAAGTATRIVERRLFERLRHRMAASYSVVSNSQLIDRSTVHRAIVADCREDTASAVADMVIQVADEMAATGPTTDEMHADLVMLTRQLRDDPRAISGWMAYAAECYLNGIDVEEFDDYLQTRQALSREEVRSAWARGMSSAILAVPPWVTVSDPRYGQTSWPAPVRGRVFHPPGLARVRGWGCVILGDEGLTIAPRDGQPATIPFATCMALIRHEEGTRILIDHVGRALSVHAADLAGGVDLINALDARIPMQRWVDIPGTP